MATRKTALTSGYPAIRAQALREAWALEDEARTIFRSLPAIAGADRRWDLKAHAIRLLDDGLALRETIGYTDPWAWSPRRAQRKRAANDPQATSHTLRLLSQDRVPSVREAALGSLAAREALGWAPVTPFDFEPVDPIDFVRG